MIITTTETEAEKKTKKRTWKTRERTSYSTVLLCLFIFAGKHFPGISVFVYVFNFNYGRLPRPFSAHTEQFHAVCAPLKHCWRMSKICGANESKWPRRGGNLKREGKREIERERERDCRAGASCEQSNWWKNTENSNWISAIRVCVCVCVNVKYMWIWKPVCMCMCACLCVTVTVKNFQ